jgi:hypothetical protein
VTITSLAAALIYAMGGLQLLGSSRQSMLKTLTGSSISATPRSCSCAATWRRPTPSA